MVKQGAARNRAACRDGRANLRRSHGTTIPFAGDMADAAFSVQTVYFMRDATATFIEIARVLRPAATLVIGCRTSDTPAPTWMDPEIHRIPTAAQLTGMLTAAGFDPVDLHTVDAAGYELHLFAAHLATPPSRSSGDPSAHRRLNGPIALDSHVPYKCQEGFARRNPAPM